MATQPPLPNPAPAAKPGAHEISSTLQDAGDPLSFILQNIRQDAVAVPRAPQTQDPASTAPNPQASSVPNGNGASAPQPSPSFAPEFGSALDFPIDLPSPSLTQAPPAPQAKPPVEPPPPESKAPEIENDLLREASEDFHKGGPKESNRKLRKIVVEKENALQEREAKLSQLESDLEKYKTGEAVPEVITEMKARIADLEKYEQLHNFRVSPEYQKRFAEPLQKKSEKAVRIAAEYNVQPEVMNQALQLPKGRERNAFLKKHFDEVGALEAKGVLDEIETIYGEAQEAELEPGRHFEALREQSLREQQDQEIKRLDSISNNARSGWLDGLNELRGSGEYPMLALKEGDEQHNAFVRPILQEAAAEFGKFVTLAGAKAMKELPAEAAKILAKRFILSQVAPLSAASAFQHFTRAEKVVTEANRINPLIRPSIGGGPVGGTPVGGAGGQKGSSGLTPASAADALLNQVVGAGRFR